MRVEVGKIYETWGGWEAIVIWQCYNREDEAPGFLVIHKPHSHEESGVTMHREDGSATSFMSINEPPVYNKHHPADLRSEVSERG